MKVFYQVLKHAVGLAVAMASAMLLGFTLFMLITLVVRAAYSDERRAIIAVIDTGEPRGLDKFECDTPHYDLTGQGIQDTNGHGTNISYLVTKELDSRKYCILIIKWWADSKHKLSTLGDAVKIANIHKAAYINMSLAGYARRADEEKQIRMALDRGAVVAVAAGNDGYDLGPVCDIFPACYAFNSNLFFVVANFIQGSKRWPESNYGGPVNAWENGVGITAGGITMTGTSQATAIFLNKYIRSKVNLKLNPVFMKR